MGLRRHPDGQAHRYRESDHWIETARILERGRLDALFLADALGPLEVCRGSPDAALRHGINTPADDPLLATSAMAAAPRRPGFAVTGSSTDERRSRVWNAYEGDTLREYVHGPEQQRLPAGHAEPRGEEPGECGLAGARQAAEDDEHGDIMPEQCGTTADCSHT
ncbi:hypothetical protein SM007_36565 [Streptomyces avermitilis]|nr:hypothetical protein [Streptomyces avermitilis]OOV18100.1 hypothetical protein SM007_36565 [Streptomyces avermitilis]